MRPVVNNHNDSSDNLTHDDMLEELGTNAPQSIPVPHGFRVSNELSIVKHLKNESPFSSHKTFLVRSRII